MYATARDWARLGQLYLQDGMWKGDRILPEGWVTYTRTPAPASPTGSYGAHFWLRIPPKYGSEDSQIPADAFHAAGHEGQFVTIVPSHGVVIVRLGKTRDPMSWDHGSFVEQVLAALRR
jgi:CubicO group peptidase (beta-lactamase class C family)